MSTGEMWFEWNGISSEDYGVEVVKLPGAVSWPIREETFSVPGRDGKLHIRDGALDEVTASIGIYIPYEQIPADGIAPLRTIRKWLSGDGILRLSDHPGRYFEASITQEVFWPQWIPGFSDVLTDIPITIQPYAYFDDAAEIVVTASGTQINNPGTGTSLPKITVAGNGDVIINIISGTKMIDFVLQGLEPGRPLTVDSRLGECYTTAGPANEMMTGEFPGLAPGINIVSWAGDISEMRILPAWRDM